MSTLAPEQIPQALKYNVVISSVLIWAFSMPKFAIIAVLKRILDYGTKTTVVFWGLALSSQACIFATSIWWYEQCTPIEHGWDTNVPGTCAAVSIMTNLGYFTSAYSAFLDIVFALYPIPSIMRLNMPLKSRIAVSVALGLSSLACVISIYKLTIFGEIFAMLEVDPTCESFLQSSLGFELTPFRLDPVAYLDILGMAEGFILLVCASLPSLGPFVRMIRGKVYSTNGSNSRSEGHNLSSSGQSRGWMSSNHSKSGNLEQPTPKRSSVDEIPLVTPPQDHSSKDIHWEMKVSVWSEDRTSKSNPTTRADSMIYQGS